MTYCSLFAAEPLPLMDLCRRVIRQNVKKERIEKGRIAELNLPRTIKDYLEYKVRQLDFLKVGGVHIWHGRMDFMFRMSIWVKGLGMWSGVQMCLLPSTERRSYLVFFSVHRTEESLTFWAPPVTLTCIRTAARTMEIRANKMQFLRNSALQAFIQRRLN